MDFESDQRKNPANPRKHGLLFLEIQNSFLDPNRTIAIDARHSTARETHSDAPTDVTETIKEAKVIDDFLPLPDELIPRDDTVRVTISLAKKSVDFFKQSANEQGVPYQTMIRKVLDLHSQRYQRE